MSNDDRTRALVGVAVVGFLAANVLCNASCRDPYTIALKSAASLKVTMAATEQSLADACHVKHVQCLEAHGPGTPGFATCTDSCVKALRTWATYTRPGFNTAIIAFVAGVQLAKSIDDKAGLLVLMKPLACAAGRGAEQWLHLLPVSARATIEAIARGVAGYTCPEVK